MEPPSLDGGDLATAGAGVSGSSLQWSRRLSTAETLVSRQRRTVELLLVQWSRRLSTAETRRLCARHVRPSARVQWSRRLSTAETPSTLLRKRSRLDGFNGAAVSRRRRHLSQ